MTTDTSTRPNSEAESTNLTLSRACICALIHDRLNVWSLYPTYPQSAADNVTTYPVYRCGGAALVSASIAYAPC